MLNPCIRLQDVIRLSCCDLAQNDDGVRTFAPPPEQAPHRQLLSESLTTLDIRPFIYWDALYMRWFQLSKYWRIY